MSSDSLDEARLTGAARGLHQNGLIAVAWAGVGTAALFLSLRCFARIREARRLFYDDYWMIFAFTVLVTNAVLQTLQAPQVYYLVDLGAGRVAVGPETLVVGNQYVRYEFAIIGFFWTILWSVKASFLALYYRLFDGMPIYRRLWYMVSTFALLAYVICWVLSAYTCHPPRTYFEFGQCQKPIDIRGGTISISYSTAVDILTDLMIMLLPLQLLRDLQVSKRQKAGLAIVFTLGLIIIAVSIIRMTQIIGQDRADPVGLAVWGLVESSVSVIVGSLPPLKAFLTSRLSKYSRRGYAYTYSRRASARKVQEGSVTQELSHTESQSKTPMSVCTESYPLKETNRSPERGNGSNGSVPTINSWMHKTSPSDSTSTNNLSPTSNTHGRTPSKNQIMVQKDFGWRRDDDINENEEITSSNVSLPFPNPPGTTLSQNQDSPRKSRLSFPIQRQPSSRPAYTPEKTWIEDDEERMLHGRMQSEYGVTIVGRAA